jgi:hypothetical protein
VIIKVAGVAWNLYFCESHLRAIDGLYYVHADLSPPYELLYEYRLLELAKQFTSNLNHLNGIFGSASLRDANRTTLHVWFDDNRERYATQSIKIGFGPNDAMPWSNYSALRSKHLGDFFVLTNDPTVDVRTDESGVE